jgi:YD repeat-containing protein
VDITPPAGGTATSTVTDARGRTVELRQYQAATPTGAYDSTTYAFSRKGLLSGVSDPVGHQWSYGYDLRGRQISAGDLGQRALAGAVGLRHAGQGPSHLIHPLCGWQRVHDHRSRLHPPLRSHRGQHHHPFGGGALAGTYIFRSTYFPDGSLASTIFPTAGGLSTESVIYGYDPAWACPPPWARSTPAK